jgi:hypothetical protein
MAEGTGTFRLSEVEGPREATLFQWSYSMPMATPSLSPSDRWDLQARGSPLSGWRPTLRTAIEPIQPAAFQRAI